MITKKKWCIISVNTSLCFIKFNINDMNYCTPWGKSAKVLSYIKHHHTPGRFRDTCRKIGGKIRASRRRCNYSEKWVFSFLGPNKFAWQLEWTCLLVVGDAIQGNVLNPKLFQLIHFSWNSLKTWRYFRFLWTSEKFSVNLDLSNFFWANRSSVCDIH